MSSTKSLLFVCLGNICRSPAAEGVARHIAGSKIRVDSCGTAGYHVGEAPDSRSIKACKKRNINISNLRARQISQKDWMEFDVIAACDRSVYNHLRGLSPKNAKANLVLFNDPSGVDDPYYGDQSGFERMVDLITEVMPSFLSQQHLLE